MSKNIGMPTLIELNTLEENIQLCKELELDFIEINMNLPEFQPNKIDINQLKYLHEKYGIFFTLHLPEDINIAHFNSNIRKANLDLIKETIIIAKAINVPIINMHMTKGIYFTLPNSKIYLYEKYKEDYIKFIGEFIECVEECIGDSDVLISIENTGIYNVDYICEGIVNMLKSSCFTLTWDIGHDHSSGNLDRNFIMRNIHKTSHFHIHDAMGKSNHLALYTGELDIDKKIELANELNCRVVIETKTVDSLRKSISALKNKK